MSTHPLRFGIQTGQQDVEFKDIESLWRQAEDWGYDSLWVFDHLYPIFSDPKGPCMEGWTTLSALAMATKRARIGHLVNGNTYRHPTLTAKLAATVDQISGGRLNLGLGAGWFELEHKSLGFDFKTTLGRLEALDESCTIVKGMLAGQEVTLDGAHYQVNEARCRPLPVQEGGPPLMIGGIGKKVLLRIVAKHADMWNAPGTPAFLGNLIDTIKGHCDQVGRDPDEIEKTVMMALCYTEDSDRQDMMVNLLSAIWQISPEDARDSIMVGNREQCLEKIEAYKAVGISHFIFMLFPPYLNDEIQAFAEEVIPHGQR